MKVAVSSEGPGLYSQVDVRFGRAKYFLIVDTETMEVKAVENTQQLDLPQGAGIQAAQNVLKEGVDVLLTGNCGPKAFKVLNSGGVKIYVGVKGTVKDAIDDFKSKKLRPATEANVEGHWI